MNKLIYAALLSFISAIMPQAFSETTTTTVVNTVLNSNKNAPASTLQKKLHTENKANKYPFSILLDQPNYLMPFYYSTRATGPISANVNDRHVKHTEFVYQFSFKLPMIKNVFEIANKPVSLYISYTQLAFWQLYVKSAYFRETNYEPEIYLSSNLRKNWLLDVGVNHQSNGRGGAQERSWNRAYFDLTGSEGNWLISFKPWFLIFREGNSGVYNPDITQYLGHERIVGAYQFPNSLELTLRVQNLERPRYLSEKASLSYPLNKKIKLYIQFFHGYGQSLIEYKHSTTSAGIGISLNNWL